MVGVSRRGWGGVGWGGGGDRLEEAALLGSTLSKERERRGRRRGALGERLRGERPPSPPSPPYGSRPNVPTPRSNDAQRRTALSPLRTGLGTESPAALATSLIPKATGSHGFGCRPGGNASAGVSSVHPNLSNLLATSHSRGVRELPGVNHRPET